MTPERLNEIDHLPNVSIFTFRELTQEIRNLRSRLSDLEAQDRWIPVSERLPEPDVSIQLAFKFGEINHGWYDAEDEFEGFYAGCEGFVVKEENPVTHWRPLPEGPEEG